eukprot:4242972-Prymnesium_polylepis.1
MVAMVQNFARDDGDGGGGGACARARVTPWQCVRARVPCGGPWWSSSASRSRSRSLNRRRT